MDGRRADAHATATPEPTPTPTATATPTPQPLPHVVLPTPTVFPAAPALTLTVPSQKLAAVLKHGLTVRVSASRPVTATISLAWGKRAPVRRVLPTPVRATMTLPASQRRALAHTRRVTLTLTLTVSAPGAKTVTRQVTLSR